MNLLKIYEKCESLPLGKRIFSFLFCFYAPYFSTINPFFKQLNPGKCIVKMKKRRSVLNHIGSVHAIAMCNLAEACGGCCIEVTLDKSLRWIPKGMNVSYLKKAMSDLYAVCIIDEKLINIGDNIVSVNIFDDDDNLVFEAKINMYVSNKILKKTA